MSLQDLAQTLAAELGVTQAKAAQALRHVWEELAETVAETSYVRLGEFGTFEVKARKARKGRNPRTGEKLVIPGRWVVTFRPGKAFLDRLAQLGPPDETPEAAGPG